MLILGGGVYYVLHTILSIGSPDGKVQGGIAKILPSKMINLGLDLKGGIYLAMEVDLQVAVNSATRRTMDDLRRRLNDADITCYRLENENSPDIILELTDAETQPKVQDVLNRYFSETLRTASRDGTKSVLTFTSDAMTDVRDMTARQALETIRNRIDMFGVA